MKNVTSGSMSFATKLGSTLAYHYTLRQADRRSDQRSITDDCQKLFGSRKNLNEFEAATESSTPL
jgi:hypothetical protein